MKSIVLPPLSLLYGAVTRTRLSLYRRGTFHTTKLDRPVISIGNITMGGTGKTRLALQVGAATIQVAHAGSAAQVDKASAILRETRKALYRILAEGDDEAS